MYVLCVCPIGIWMWLNEMQSANSDKVVEGENFLSSKPMPETSFLHYTPGEINKLLHAQKTSKNNVNINTDRAGKRA